MMTSRVFLWAVLWAALLAARPLAAAEGRPTDAKISESLQDTFGSYFQVRGGRIQVTCMLGAVTLKGEVPSYLDRHYAEQIAKKTPGVRSVTNALRVTSPLRGDGEIAADVRRRLMQSSFLQARHVDVAVAAGAVTLSGQVGSWAERRQAQLVSAEVRGVRWVRNELVIGVVPARADDVLAAQVRAALARDAYLAELPLAVAAESGRVTLTGHVDTLFQKELAEEEARLSGGVIDVDNRLEIAPRSPPLADLGAPTDEMLAAEVLAELHADPRIETSAVSVTAVGDRVTLDGRVGTMFERLTAERVARTVIGVRAVENRLQVETGDRHDQEILADIRFNLSSDAQLADQAIDVEVRGGHVQLAGTVTGPHSRLRAAQLAARVRGVRSIDNQLAAARGGPPPAAR